MNDLISIIVPVYNVEKYLEKCVKTLMNQSYENIEIILVDDGATDSSGELADSLANNDTRITVVHKKNAGLGMARNTGLEYATGKYVAFIDSDDYVDVNMIQKLHNALEEYNSDTSYCGYTMEYDSEKLVPVPAYYNKQVFLGEEIIDKVLLEMVAGKPEAPKDAILSMSVWHALYSMDIIRDNNIRFPSEREFISEDIIFDIAYLQKSKSVCYINDPLYFYRCNNVNSLTHQYNDNEFARQKKQIEKIEFELGKFIEPEQFRYRTDRYFLGRYRTCVQKAIRRSEVDPGFELYNHIFEMTTDDKTRRVIARYPFWKNPIKQRVFNFCIRIKFIPGILLLGKLSTNGKNRRF